MKKFFRPATTFTIPSNKVAFRVDSLALYIRSVARPEEIELPSTALPSFRNAPSLLRTLFSFSFFSFLFLFFEQVTIPEISQKVDVEGATFEKRTWRNESSSNGPRDN